MTKKLLTDLDATGRTITAGTFSGSGASLTSIPNSALTNSSITINGSAISLGGTVTTPNTFPTTWAWTGGTTSGPTASITGTSSTISVAAVPAASGSASGIVTTGSQTFAGTKTFSSNIYANDSGWISSNAPNVIITAATGWSLTSFSIRRLNGMVNGIITVSRTGANVTVPGTGNIANQNVATLSSGWYGSSADSGMVLTNGSGPLIGGYVQVNGTLTISAMSSGATISTGDTFSFTLWEMLD